MTAKAYVAPAVILARLVTVVRTAINIANITLWIDSATVLHWLQNPASNFKPFVSTRVQEINESVPEALDCFGNIISSLNPANALTKPIQNFKLSKWHHGPKFLLQTSLLQKNNNEVTVTCRRVFFALQVRKFNSKI